jgi:hypothetical protein
MFLIFKLSNLLQYEKYFSMLRLGVPKPKIKIMMFNEGLDPDVIE